MQNKRVERLLHAHGYYLVRNGRKHAIYSDGKVQLALSHGKMSPGAYKQILKHLEAG